MGDVVLMHKLWVSPVRCGVVLVTYGWIHSRGLEVDVAVLFSTATTDKGREAAAEAITTAALRVADLVAPSVEAIEMDVVRRCLRIVISAPGLDAVAEGCEPPVVATLSWHPKSGEPPW